MILRDLIAILSEYDERLPVVVPSALTTNEFDYVTAVARIGLAETPDGLHSSEDHGAFEALVIAKIDPLPCLVPDQPK